MRRSLTIALMLVGSIAKANYTTIVDPAVRYQTWEGWGTSLCWWANMVGGYPEPQRTILVNKVFKGLGLTIARYNIGGGEAPGLDSMELRARVPGYLRTDGTYDWTADKNQRWVLQRAKALGVNRFEAFSNSPPYWMTWSGSVTGNHGGGNNFNDAYRKQFAAYLATVTRHFHRAWGIDFETLEPMNEPAAGWWTYGGRQEGCHVDPGELQSSIVTAVGERLAAYGLTTMVSCSDESVNDWAVTSWDALSPAAKTYVRRMNTHSYGGSSQHSVNHRAARDGKRLWMSEYGDGDATGLTMSLQILRDLRLMMPTAWVYWQAIDNGGGWGCIDMDMNSRSTSYVVNPKYWVMAQYSRFIRPGAQFVSIGDPNSVACLKDGRLVIVTTNAGLGQKATYDLSRFSTLPTTATLYRTSLSERLRTVGLKAVSNGKLTANVPANSVSTFVLDGCAYGDPTFDGFYSLTSEKTGNNLDVPGATWDEGALLTTWPDNGGLNQQWRVEGTEGGFYRFCSRESGQYAALWDSADNHYPVLQWSDNGDTTLDWSLIRLPFGAFRLENRRHPGMALVENPTRGNGWPDVCLYDWYDGPEQRWSLNWRSALYPP